MNNVYVFHGADGKTGTTMITQSVAEYIASRCRKLKSMMISMHGRPGTEYVDKVGESIEGIRLHLDSKLLNITKLVEECRRSENFYMLGGVENIEKVRNYHPEMAVYLLENLSEVFDLVFVDSGNDIDNALAVGALECVDNRYCIVTQQESILRRYETVKPIYEKLGIDFTSYIVNKYSDTDSYDLRYIEKRLNITPERLMKIGISGYERVAESEKKTLLHYKNDKFCNDIHALANRILCRSQMPSIESERKRRWRSFI